MGGYYHPDRNKTEAAMRPSAVLNGIIDALLGGKTAAVLA
jgi:monomeric isocitrate dehydrogenase